MLGRSRGCLGAVPKQAGGRLLSGMQIHDRKGSLDIDGLEDTRRKHGYDENNLLVARCQRFSKSFLVFLYFCLIKVIFDFCF